MHGRKNIKLRHYVSPFVALIFPGPHSNHEHEHSLTFTDPVMYKTAKVPVFWNVTPNSLKKLRNFRKNLLSPPMGRKMEVGRYFEISLLSLNVHKTLTLP